MEAPPSPDEDENISADTYPNTIRTAVLSRLNRIREMYFDSSILERLQGRISSSLIVPQENSPATESEAITTVKIVFRKKETLTVVWKLFHSSVVEGSLLVK
ncbi:hypothetical protein D3C75_835620 [compost metagenome]